MEPEPAFLYHYTDRFGYCGILKDGKINMSNRETVGSNAYYGNGVYFTDIKPEETKEKILRNNYGGLAMNKERKDKADFFIEVKFQDLKTAITKISINKQVVRFDYQDANRKVSAFETVTYLYGNRDLDLNHLECYHGETVKSAHGNVEHLPAGGITQNRPGPYTWQARACAYDFQSVHFRRAPELMGLDVPYPAPPNPVRHYRHASEFVQYHQPMRRAHRVMPYGPAPYYAAPQNPVCYRQQQQQQHHHQDGIGFGGAFLFGGAAMMASAVGWNFFSASKLER